jgi:adenine-specific DNA methylase
MADGSLKLHDHPGDMVRVACEKCGRARQYRKEKFSRAIRLKKQKDQNHFTSERAE